jgi:hypothetical protein
MLAPRVARADVSSWLAGGGGYGIENNRTLRTTDRASIMSWSLGVGSSPNNSFVVGGIFRTVTFFGLGSDMSLGPRFATGGFARGQWGVALDAALVARWWREWDYGQYPMRFVLTGGMPWGLNVAVAAETWSIAGGTQAKAVFGLIEIDLLRLTVMRKGGTDVWWANPSPAGGR